MLTTVFRFRCPSCGRGAVFSGVYALHERCGVCGVVYDRDGGLWSGPVVTVYALGSVAAFAFWFFLIWAGRDFDGVEYLLSIVSLTVIFSTYRYAKSSWLWLLYRTGRVYADEARRTRPRSATEQLEG